MMNIKSFTCGIMDNNAYLLWEEGKKDAVLIDAPFDSLEEVDGFCDKNNLTLAAVLLTHGHFDHIADLKFFQDSGVKVYIHEGDADKLSDAKKSLGSMRMVFSAVAPDVTFVGEDQEIKLAGIDIKVIHTPGHSKGSVCYLADNQALFAGDTMFCGSYGITDFYDGNLLEIKASFKKLFDLATDLPVYPGHGPATSLFAERAGNVLNIEL